MSPVHALQRARKTLGWPGTVGALAIAASLGLHAYTVGMEAKTDQAARRIEQARRDRSAAGGAEEVAVSDQLRSFVASLPDAARRDLDLARLGRLANDHRLETTALRYTGAPDAPSHRFGTTIVSLSIRGRYPDIRRFVLAALDQMPALALQRLNVESAVNRSAVPHARLDFLYFHNPRQGDTAHAVER